MTQDQKDKIRDILVARVEKLERLGKISNEAGHRILNKGDELADGFEELLIRLAKPQDFASEQVASTSGYLSGYKAPTPIADQVVALKRYFSKLGTCDEVLAVTKAEGTEGSFAIPKWQLLAPTYGEAVELVLAALRAQRGDGKFVSFRKGELGPKRLRETSKKADVFKTLAEQQKGHDILVVDAQFGIEHRGESVRRARVLFQGNEFGLGAFEIGIMLLTHPERLLDINDLRVDCSGDEYSFDADGRFDGAPHFLFNDGQLEFGADDVMGMNVDSGSASGFLRQL
ncbi:MAG: hypothetical protein NT003_00595 [Candidatus Magasanikbacteria bacterium]|nr:hypothetical protein [Candidatus Magasanikbacteria bacterium]